MFLLTVLFTAGQLMGQSAPQRPSGEMTVQGCVSVSGAHFVLVQTDPGNVYQLEASNDTVMLDRYLGQQVEVTGRESVSLSATSDLARPGSPSSVSLTVRSVRPLAGRCTAEALP